MANVAEEIYQKYPRKVGKREAMKAIEKALARLPEELEWQGMLDDLPFWLMGKVERYAKAPAGNRGHLTPHPSTWFNQSRYLDDEIEWDEMTPRELEDFKLKSQASVGVYRPT